jgi:hypothetical protein
MRYSSFFLKISGAELNQMSFKIQDLLSALAEERKKVKSDEGIPNHILANYLTNFFR